MPKNQIEIPDKALEALNQVSGLEEYVKSSVSTVSLYIDSSRTDFFPEYTDHKNNHTIEVLKLSYELINENSLKILTPHDHAALIIATIIHDLGMHISIDGFYTLVSDPPWLKTCDFFKDGPWSSRWQRFISEARRYDSSKLRSLFGDRFHSIKGFPEKGEPLNEFDILLAGEFLRQNHHILAHQIANSGLPTKNGEKLELFPSTLGIDDSLIDISGLIARSHGTSLRSMFDYLEDVYDDKIAPRGIHPVFLMAVLRTSDYLQIQSERAPLPRSKAVAMRSPISSREWKVHQSVKGIRNTGDPETLQIDAEPKDLESYARLRWWLDDIQSDLDSSWAAIGEIYGLQKHTRLDQLGLKIRRIKSNIDNKEKLRKKIDYIPEIVRIRANDDQLLRNLIGPLYGDFLGAGLRELVQNSADAVLEANALKVQSGFETQSDFWDIGTDIEVKIEKDKEGNFSTLTITDRGVGMTLETIKNHFLNVGSSYRHSKEWNRLHQSYPEDKFRLRSGRFGVGVLAGFLIGSSMHVRTRGILQKESEGLDFTVGITDELIEIRNAKLPVGTQIQIELSEQFKKHLIQMSLDNRFSIGFDPKQRLSGRIETRQLPGSLGDYYGENPSYSVILGDKKLYIEPSSYLSNSKKDPLFSNAWKKFFFEDLTILWTYQTSKPAFSVNNFLVGLNQLSLNDGTNWELSLRLFNTPAISVLDRFGTFPLDMRRRGIGTHNLPFETELIKSITREFAYSLVCHLVATDVPRSGKQTIFNGIRYQFEWHRSAKGLVPSIPAIFKAMNVKRCYSVKVNYGNASLVPAGQDLTSLYCVQRAEQLEEGKKTWENIRDFFGNYNEEYFVGVSPMSTKRYAPLNYFFDSSSNSRQIESALEKLAGEVRYADFENWITDYNFYSDTSTMKALAWRLDNSLAGEKYYVEEIMLDYSNYQLSKSEIAFLESWISTIGSLELPNNQSDLLILKTKIENMTNN